jgi:hypothetical protein
VWQIGGMAKLESIKQLVDLITYFCPLIGSNGATGEPIVCCKHTAASNGGAFEALDVDDEVADELARRTTAAGKHRKIYMCQQCSGAFSAVATKALGFKSVEIE